MLIYLTLFAKYSLDMKLVILCMLMLSAGFNTLAQPEENALEFNVSVWKKAVCEPGVVCLPQRLAFKEGIYIDYPPMDSFYVSEVQVGQYKAKFILIRSSKSGGYFSFQTEFFEDGESIALCSRYETLETFESIPVGACAGRSLVDTGSIVGISVLP